MATFGARLKAAIARHGLLGTAVLAIRNARHLLSPTKGARHFRGAFGSYQEALAAVHPDLHAGYDNEVAVLSCYEIMCTVLPWDSEVLVLLERLLPETRTILDAGGHMGTKYRAFRERLDLDNRVKWIVWDTPTAVRMGRQRAIADGLHSLSFVDAVTDAPPVDLLLCSGLLQYLDIPFADLIGQLVEKPRHLILNKVATRDGPTVVMLENVGGAEVPYQIRDRAEFLHTLDALGYEIVDEWVRPEFDHVVVDKPELGASTNRGYHARLR